MAPIKTKLKAVSADSDQASDLAAAGRVLSYAADALRTLGEVLDGEFTRAVATILAARGRVIVSGMGKSGHVARKIAATMASTGTPAQFVHPAEASHGDMGMVTSADAVVALAGQRSAWYPWALLIGGALAALAKRHTRSDGVRGQHSLRRRRRLR